MRIKDILSQDKVTVSFEVFPPKKIENMESTLQAAHDIAALHPDFMSVTYGAGGTTRKYTIDVASHIQQEFGTTVLPHLTCIATTKDGVDSMLAEIHSHGIENIMALRGDVPKDGHVEHDFAHADELIAYIRSQKGGSEDELSIGGACYPEGHPESSSRETDLDALKAKIDAGCDFLTTQMFFDNDVFFNFLYRVRDKGMTIPILAGIMPITNAKQLGRSVALSGTSVPSDLRAIVDKFGSNPAAMKQAGILYASSQIIDLIANGVTHIHVYSMNKPDVAKGILENLSEMLG